MLTVETIPPAPAKRPYVAPALVTHGTVQTLTQGQTGTQLDQDSSGSFVPDGGQ